VRPPKLPQDVMFDLPSASLSADNILSRMKIAFENVHTSFKKSQGQQSQHFNDSINDSDFHIGDLVVYGIPTRKVGEPDKLQPKRKGPYVRIAKFSDQS